MPTDYVKASVFEAYKQEVNNKISAVYRLKGSVESYNALPVYDREIGDVWNALDTGANYAWTNEGWDKLSENLDLSGYVKTSTFEELVTRVEKLERSGT